MLTFSFCGATCEFIFIYLR